MTHRISLRTLFASGAIVLLFAAAWLVATRSSTLSEATDATVSSNLLAVRGAVARFEQWPDTIEAFGNIAPWDEIIVSAQVEGQPLIELLVNVGDRVRRGQVLARFDTAMLAADVSRLRADVERASAEARRADSERDRALQLAGSGGISEQEVLQRVTGAEVSAAQLRASRAQLAARELDLRRATVVAPDSGAISSRSAQTGVVGTPGLELFRIVRRDRLEWRGELTAAQLARVAPGQRVQLSLPAGASADARIRQISPTFDIQTRLAAVFADVDPVGSARAGTYVSGRIILGDRPAVVVPASSIEVRDGHSLIFTVALEEREWRVRQRRVEVGRRRGAEVEVVNGLRAGEHVVARGAAFLDDGDIVRLVNAASPEGRNDGATP